jgi:thiosulfate dehydrogenase [quinone] large subunit
VPEKHNLALPVFHGELLGKGDTPIVRVKARILGHESALEYSPELAGYGILAMRVGLGWFFFHTGVTRLLDPTWTIHTKLATVPEANPFPKLCTWMGGHAAWILDPLFSWGFAFVGAGLMFGACVGASVVLGVTLMLLTWVMSVSVDVGIVTRHIVFILFMFGLVTLGAGRIAGLDALFECHSVFDRHPSLKWLLG